MRLNLLKMRRKSQIQMGETIAVLVIFFILIVIGFTFYTRVIKGSVEIQREESRQLKAVEIAQRASFLPEVQCSEENIIIDNCIDILKLEAATEGTPSIIENNEIFYFDRLQFSDISIEEIYPGSNSWVLYSKSLGGAIFTSKISTNVPIALFDPTVKTYSFGVMKVDTFAR